MPEPWLFLESGLVAAAVAGVLFLLLALAGDRAERLGWVLGPGIGFLAGCRVLELWPDWPPGGNRDRFLVVLFPALLAVEGAAAWPPPRWVAWLLRGTLSLAVAPILLYQTTYIADLSGPGTREWPPAQAVCVFLLLGTGLAGLWGLLALLPGRPAGRSVLGALSLSCGASGLLVAIYGYPTGGSFGVPLAGALAGVALASLPWKAPTRPEGALGVGVVGLCVVLEMGRFFAALGTGTALCLFFSPLLGWVPELPGLRRLPSLLRAALGLVLIALPLAYLVWAAYQQFVEEYGPGI